MVSVYERQADAVGFKLFGIQFDPLFQPLYKRWDLIRVGIVLITGVLIGPFLPFILLSVLISPLWPLIPLYCWWFIHDWNTPRTGGRSNSWMRNHPVVSMKNYFPSTLVKTADLPANQNYLLCAFPHGLACFGILSNFMPDAQVDKVFPGIEPRVISMNALFNVPIGREFLLLSGFSSSNAENITTLLNHKDKNKAVILMVGGAAECMIAEPGTNKVVINGRKGFVKLALKAGSRSYDLSIVFCGHFNGDMRSEEDASFRGFMRATCELNNSVDVSTTRNMVCIGGVLTHNISDVHVQAAPLVPVYTFGENEVFDQYRGKLIQWFQNFFRKWLGVPPIFIKGRGIFQRSFGVLPQRNPLFTVVGKPIALPKCENPSNEEIDKYHKIFISELKTLFDTHKERYDKKGSEAELICL